MPTMMRREDGARLGAGPLGPWLWTLAHWGRWSLGAGRLVGAGWRGMPARAICCEPDSGKGGRQAKVGLQKNIKQHTVLGHEQNQFF
jgi:hypothetical protein